MSLSATEQRSFSGKRWTGGERTAHVSALVAALAAARGIHLEGTAPMTGPSVFPDLVRVTERIGRAIREREVIGIFGDYDCDGITATAQLVRYFRRHGTEPFVRLPHRVSDGYGLHAGIVREMQQAGVRLLITCDTGISAIQETTVLTAAGIDVIITDHHHVRAELPPAYAIIHPALSPHPLPHPSGAGVVFKLIAGLEQGSWEGQQTDHALAMMGTVADLVPLTGDNRTLVQGGLNALEALQNGPLAELRERCRSNALPLTAGDIAFRVAPRINAAGRMEHPDTALRALLSGGEDLHTLDLLNTQRQEQTAELLTEITARGGADSNKPFLLFASETFPHGLLGLLSGKLTETFGRPSLVAAIEGSCCTASLRSPPCYDIAAGLERIAPLLLRFGGHAQAAGCTFSHDALETVREALEADVRAHVPAEDLVPVLHADAELLPQDVTPKLLSEIALLEPFGQGNNEPRFLFRNVALRDTRAIGNGGVHLRGTIHGIGCIGFRLGNFAGISQNIDIIGRVSMNTWNGKSSPQIVIEDMREALFRQAPAFPPSQTPR